MTEIAAPAPQKPVARPTRTLRERLTSNPVVLKELRGRMRGNRAFVILTIYLGLMSLFTTLLYLAYTASSNVDVYGPSGGQIAGKVVFAGLVGIELFLVCFIAPAFTAGAISGERERQTYELLRTTLLPARSLVLGKLTSALSFIVLLLIAAVPLQSLAFLLGGVALEEVLIALAMLLVTALASGSAGIFFSTIMRRTLGASVLTYATALIAVLGLPLLMLTFIPAYDFFFYGSSYNNFSPSPLLQSILVYAFYILICVNPLATAFVTETILINDQSAFFSTFPLSNGNSIPIFSPWIPYVLFCLFFSLIVILISIQLVRRKETT
ncbi:MAG: ABC transporter permease [Chloroflexi bacterium]|nr:ABC transporter permease [Chloroflexota bacterium]